MHAAVGQFGLGASVGGTVVGLSLVHGGYAPAAWGWTALLGFWATLLALVFRSDRRVDRAGVALVAGVTAVAGWTALSSLWTQSVPRTMLELERDLVYVAIAAAVLLLCNVERPLAARVGSRRRPGRRHRLRGRRVLRERARARRHAGLPALPSDRLCQRARRIGGSRAPAGHRSRCARRATSRGVRCRRVGRRAVGRAPPDAEPLGLPRCRSRTRRLVVSERTPPIAPRHIAIAVGVALAAVASLDLFDAHRAITDIGERRIGAAAIVIVLAAVAFVLAPRMRRLTIRARGSLAARGSRRCSWAARSVALSSGSATERSTGVSPGMRSSGIRCSAAARARSTSMAALSRQRCLRSRRAQSLPRDVVGARCRRPRAPRRAARSPHRRQPARA